MTTAGPEISLLALSPAQRRSATLAAVVGNALEWFDFSVYGYLATPIGHTFFPADSASMQVVAAFGVFAVGYLMRPIGSLVLGGLVVGLAVGVVVDLGWRFAAWEASRFRARYQRLRERAAGVPLREGTPPES